MKNKRFRTLPDRIEYYNDKGEIHRLDGPAVEFDNGDKEWWINGSRHRLDGPAIEWDDSGKWWYINDKIHREDGPAIEWSNGYKSWYLNDIQYTEEQYQQEIIKLKLKRLVEL